MLGMTPPNRHRGPNFSSVANPYKNSRCSGRTGMSRTHRPLRPAGSKAAGGDPLLSSKDNRTPTFAQLSIGDMKDPDALVLDMNSVSDQAAGVP